MDKEKQIEAMAQCLCEWNRGTLCILDDKDCDLQCTYGKLANKLIAKGYRKSTDVAEEIFAEIEKNIDVELSIIQKIINAKGGRANGKTVLLAKTEMFIEAKKFIAELKKKYTEEGK